MDKQLTRTDVTSKSKVLTPTGQSDQIGYYGGFVSRAVAFIIDLFIIAGTIATVGFLYQNFIRFIGIGPGLIPKLLPWIQVAVNLITSPEFANLVAFFYLLGYFIFFWWLAGQTPGKAIMGVKIVTINGKKLSLLRSTIRLFGYLVDILTLAIGFLWILIDDRRMGFHDKIARTYVVYTWSARQDEKFLSVALSNLDVLRTRAKRIAIRKKGNPDF